MPNHDATDDPGQAGERSEQKAVTSSPAFQAWRARLPSFELDGERLYLPTGDVPMDEGQLADYWVRLTASRGGPGEPEA